jgi:hypothetical protein
MVHLIDKDALVAEIERRRDDALMRQRNLETIGDESILNELIADGLNRLIAFIDTLEVKEVDLEKERISECPFRQVVCTTYIDKTLECNGACSWVVDYPKLKKLKAQKGE